MGYFSEWLSPNAHASGAWFSAMQGRGTGGDAWSAKSNGLSGPTDINYHYTFGDYLNGNYAAAQQAQRQAAADYDEWTRNEYSAQQQRAFQEYMDSTKVQRAMADIEAAGLNPWLALQSAGFGGAVPTGAAASSSAGQMASGNGSGQSFAATAFGLAALIKAIAKVVK